MRPAGAPLDKIHASSQLSTSKPKRQRSEGELNLFSGKKEELRTRADIKPIAGVSSVSKSIAYHRRHLLNILE